MFCQFAQAEYKIESHFNGFSFDFTSSILLLLLEAR